MQLGGQCPQVLGPLGHLNAQECFNRQAVGLVVDHGRYVVQTVGQGDDLDVVALLGQLLRAPVEVAEYGLNLQDILTVKGHAQAEHPVGAGVLRPDIYGHWFGFDRHGGAVSSQLSAVS